MNPSKSKRKRGYIYLLIGVSFLLLIIVATSKSAIDYTSQPSFCGSCHLMQTRYVSWERSLHNKATCFQCHSSPGFVGETEAKVNGIKYLYYEYKGYRDVQILRAEVSNESCMRCHTIEEMDEKMERSINPVQHPPTSHKSHVLDLKISCTACHGNIMHINLEGQSKKALNACKDCHYQTDFVNLINKVVF